MKPQRNNPVKPHYNRHGTKSIPIEGLPKKAHIAKTGRDGDVKSDTSVSNTDGNSNF